MKTLFFCIFSLLLTSTTVFSQKTKDKKEKISGLENLSPQARHDYYVQMGNNQKLLGWFTLGVGTSMIIGGSAKMVSPSFKGVSKTDPRLIWLPATGFVAAVSSYFIVRAGKQKRKKANLILEEESAYIGNPQSQPIYYPSFGLSIPIN
ncbi:MAG: hypothetical protein KGP35_02985 [Bacteroidetes bacterium]|nr:hypothetical protein [Bacteroidota bacterium]